MTLIITLTILTITLITMPPLHSLSSSSSSSSSLAALAAALSPCRTACGGIPIRHPFGVDDGCGAPQFRRMLNCSAAGELFFATPSGGYKVESIDYARRKVVVFDPAMSTCSILQPRREFAMTDVQWALVPPASDTAVALLNCSADSPVLNHYKYLCFNFSGHSCDELYAACNAFRVFHFLTNSSPPCCFTRYDTMKFMSMNILDCTHYTTVLNTDSLRGVGPLDWVYGIKLSYTVPDTGCERCVQSGGTCGFDTDTEGPLCLCSPSSNYTRECAGGSLTAEGQRRTTISLTYYFCFVLFFLFIMKTII